MARKRSAPPAIVATALPDIECACASVRRTARLVTQLYGEEIGGALEASQFSLLTVLNLRPGSSQAPLGRSLGLDKTTLSRNLRLMQKNGWIAPLKSEDHRERGYRLTATGEKMLAAAKPGWKRAQEKLRAALAPGEWETMLALFGKVARAAVAARN